MSKEYNRQQNISTNSKSNRQSDTIKSKDKLNERPNEPKIDSATPQTSTNSNSFYASKDTLSGSFRRTWTAEDVQRHRQQQIQQYQPQSLASTEAKSNAIGGIDQHASMMPFRCIHCRRSFHDNISYLEHLNSYQHKKVLEDAGISILPSIDTETVVNAENVRSFLQDLAAKQGKHQDLLMFSLEDSKLLDEA